MQDFISAKIKNVGELKTGVKIVSFDIFSSKKGKYANAIMFIDIKEKTGEIVAIYTNCKAKARKGTKGERSAIIAAAKEELSNTSN